ncbi:MAG TPA: diguanylate cyclase [Candidatus Acidoferrum sp.]|nr:diguanylate cyclase [Candidatus Acidoferrum sp.]
MNDSSLKVLLAEGGSSEASVSLRTFSTTTDRCDQMYLVSSSTSILEALQKHRPDVALLQMLVLQPDPAATVRHLHACVPEVALIIWTETADKEIAAQCIQAGAKDYMLEGFVDARTLDRILRTAIAAKAVIRAPEDAQESGANAANRSVQAGEGHPMERPGSAGGAARVCIEVQNFRMLRGRNGRFAAEEILQRIAQTLKKSVRASDSVSSNRAGQFVVALQNTEAPSLPAVRRRIAARLLPFQQSSGLRATLDFCIDGEVIPGKMLARSREHRGAATLPESREPRILARP